MRHTFLLGWVLALAAPATAAVWTPVVQLSQAVDLSRQLPNGAIVVAATNGLALLHPGKPLAPFAPPYTGFGGDEPYMVVSPPRRHGGCSFGKETVYVLRLSPPTGVVALDGRGRISQFANIPVSAGSATGITFDEVGRFRHRLLVVVTAGIESALYAIDCHGRVSTLAQHMPKIEGGMEVAPKGFAGRFGGYLIAPDEVSGHIYAIPPNGRGEVLIVPPLPAGADAGVESVGFVPSWFGARSLALVADRVTPNNPHPGDGVILGIPEAQLMQAGVKPGDLLAVTEGGAQTAAIRCRRICHARVVATGPAAAHAEGHLTFTREPILVSQASHALPLIPTTREADTLAYAHLRLIA